MADLQPNHAHSAPQPIEYRPIEGFPGYRVGSDGTVWSCWKRGNPNQLDGSVRPVYAISSQWSRLKLSKNRTGYPRAALYRDGIQRKVMVHLLVLEAFVGPRPSGMEGCHGNDIKGDNRLENLRWDTPFANWSDRRLNGRATKKLGCESHFAKLTESQVRSIRSLRIGGAMLKDIALEFNVTATTVSMICNRRTYANVL